MYMHEENEKEIKRLKKIQFRKIWITAVFITIGIIWIEAFVGCWLAGKIGFYFSVKEGMIIAVFANLLIGFYNGVKRLWKGKKK